MKGWSVTLIIASTFAVGANQNVHPSILLFLMVFVIAFGLVELKQARLSALFGKRLLQLEREFPRVRRLLEPDSRKRAKLSAVPDIAHQLHDDARRRCAVARKERRLRALMAAVSRSWNAIHPSFQERHALTVRRELQRLALLMHGRPVPPTRLLDDRTDCSDTVLDIISGLGLAASPPDGLLAAILRFGRTR